MRRALIIATGSYDDVRFTPLPDAGEDADSLEEVLTDREIGGFRVTMVKDRIGREVAIAVEQFFKDATADDTLLLYLCGHGETDGEGHLYFINSDTKPGLLNATALSAHDVNKEMRNSRARAIMVMLDTCHSGAFVRGGSRGNTVEIEAEILQGRGRVVLTAAKSAQLSYGDFTRAVLEGLRTGAADGNRDGFIDAQELYVYASSQVPTNQTPTYHADIVYGPLYVARNVSSPPDLAAPAFPPLRRRSVWGFGRPRRLLHSLRERSRRSGCIRDISVGWLICRSLAGWWNCA